MVDAKIEKISTALVDDGLLEQMKEITKPSYVDNSEILKRELEHCSEIYLLFIKDNTLAAFFMVNYEAVNTTETYYLGLSACSAKYKGKGFVKYLYTSFFIDCKLKEIELNTKIVCWWTTATPLVYYWFNKNIVNCEPSLNGTLSDKGVRLLSEIVKQRYGHIKVNPATPFVLKGVAVKTNYSLPEKKRLEKIARELKIDAFKLFPIDESKGDRYLMYGYSPELDVLKKRISELVSKTLG